MDSAVPRSNNFNNHLSEIIERINTQTYSVVGEDLLSSLTENLAETLSLDYVLIGTLTDDKHRVRCNAVYPRGSFPCGFTYDLDGTPCKDVFEQNTCLYQDNVSEKYPQDLLLKQANIQGYIGIPLFNAKGEPIGILVGLSKHPIPHANTAHAIFKLYAERASAELNRLMLGAKLEEHAAFSDTICETIPSGIVLINQSGEVFYSNSQAENIAGLIETTNNTRYITNRIFDRDGASLNGPAHPISAAFSGDGIKQPKYLLQKNQQKTYISIYASAPSSDILEQQTVILSILDITEKEHYKKNHDIANKIIDHASEGIIITDRNGTIISVNSAFEAITGYTLSEVKGKNPSILQSGRQGDRFYSEMWEQLQLMGQWSGEIWNRNKEGRIYPEHLAISQVHNDAGNVTHYIGIFRDETSHKRLQSRIAKLKTQDPVTGLPNDYQLHEEITVRLTKANGGQISAFMIDLMQFKSINECLGVEVGDKLMRLVKWRLNRILHRDDFLAKLSGDEFIIISANQTDDRDADQFAEQIINSFSDNFVIGDELIYLKCNVGICISDKFIRNSRDIVHSAEMALSNAKKQGAMQYSLFEPRHKRERSNNLKLEAQLKAALDRCDIYNYYQPQIDLRSGRPISAEALVRWAHPTLGIIKPGIFIPLAEKTGLIRIMTEQVLSHACRQMKKWLVQGLQINSVAVNVASTELTSDYLPQLVNENLKKFKLHPKHLELEITESALLNRTEAIATLKQIDRLGVRIALDDFGTGYSCLSYLKDLPIHKLKIDRSFLEGIPDNEGNLSIVKAVISLAESLQMTVLAEGIESEQQAELLKSLNCFLGQGFLYSKPLPPFECSKLFALHGIDKKTSPNSKE